MDKNSKAELDKIMDTLPEIMDKLAELCQHTDLTGQFLITDIMLSVSGIGTNVLRIRINEL